MRRIACRALPILALVVSVAPTDAQSLVCHPIRRGESAGQAARRVTGNSRNMYSASFQIMNGSSRFVPKSQYDRLRAGWRACRVVPSARATVSPPGRLDDETDAPQTSATPDAMAPVAVAPPVGVAIAEPLVRFHVTAQPAASISPRPGGNVDLTIVWLGTAIAAPWLGFQILNAYATRRRTSSVLVQHFAHRFIAEFERPLVVHQDTEPPLKSRVRRRRRGRFDILLAPGQGRQYPNLTDHKRNVEYDVDRIVSALDDPAFVNGALYTQAEWVVVPFQPRTGSKPTGITCISSF